MFINFFAETQSAMTNIALHKENAQSNSKDKYINHGRFQFLSKQLTNRTSRCEYDHEINRITKFSIWCSSSLLEVRICN